MKYKTLPDDNETRFDKNLNQLLKEGWLLSEPIRTVTPDRICATSPRIIYVALLYKEDDSAKINMEISNEKLS